MESITTRVDRDTREEIDELADECGSSVSEVTRDLIRKGMEYDDLEAERDRLVRELAPTNRRVDEHQELVEFVEDERGLREQEIERRRERE